MKKQSRAASIAAPHVDQNAADVILAGMLGVSAMAVQNALVREALRGAFVGSDDDQHHHFHHG